MFSYFQRRAVVDVVSKDSSDGLSGVRVFGVGMNRYVFLFRTIRVGLFLYVPYNHSSHFTAWRTGRSVGSIISKMLRETDS